MYENLNLVALTIINELVGTKKPTRPIGGRVITEISFQNNCLIF